MHSLIRSSAPFVWLLSLSVFAPDVPALPAGAVPRAGPRADAFAGWYHDAGDLRLHVSNRGRFGNAGADAGTPSAEWPAGSGDEYLYAAGLWVGGVVGADTMVTAGLYQIGEFYNHEPDEGCGDPLQGICVSGYGAPGGARFVDDDGDGSVDEDRLDGKDNDSDGFVDEDYAAISNQMYATAYYDTSTFFNQFLADTLLHHRPLGLAVTQETYVWSDDASDDFVGVELRVRNVSRTLDGTGWDIDGVYIGMMVDADVGDGFQPYADDQCAYVAADTTYQDGGVTVSASVRMAYAFDEPGQGDDDVPGYLGVMLLGDDAHVFRVWSSGAEDPADDGDRYRILRGGSDVAPTIDPSTVVPNDYRYVLSAGPVGSLAPEEERVFRVAFVAGEMVARPGGLVPDLTNALRAQRIHDGYTVGDVVHWATGAPPAAPASVVTAGNGRAVVEWDDAAEWVPDPVHGAPDFAGYYVERNGPFAASPPADGWSIVREWDSGSLGEIETEETGIGHYRWTDHGLRNFRRYAYRVGTIDTDGWRIPGPTRVVEPHAGERVVAERVLARPNPWRAGAHDGAPVEFLHLPDTATLRVYSVDGRQVALLPPGRTEWTPITGGIYLWRAMDGDGRTSSGKVVVIR